MKHIRPFLILFALLFLAACGFFAEPMPALHGTIVNAYTNKPVANVQIVAGKTELSSNANGEYTLETWKPKDTMELSAPGYEALSLPLQTIVLQSDSTSATLSLKLRPNTLQGSVYDAYSNEPVAGSIVMVQNNNTTTPTDETAENREEKPVSATTILSATTDTDGHYTMAGVPETFTLKVTAPDYKSFDAEFAQTTAYEVPLRPDWLSGSVTDRYNEEPLSNAIVTLGTITTTTESDGSYIIRGIPEETEAITITADGYATFSQPLSQTANLNVALRPDELYATLIDETTGDPIRFATIIATPTLTDTAVTMARIDNSTDGQFVLEDLPEEGFVQVLSPGYRKAVLEIEPGKLPAEIELEQHYIRSLYIKSSTAAYLPGVLEEFFDIIDATELNAIVIDLKSDNMGDLGLIYYQSEVPIIKELGTSQDILDIRAILADAKSRDIYTIARIHIFSHDNMLAETMPEWAAQDRNGCTPNENRICNGDIFYADWDIAWLDPWNQNIWEYNIQLGVEAAQLGFDEIQFDYIRFASDAKNLKDMVLSKPIDPENNPEAMYENIAAFMEQAHEAINGVGAFFSADVFGYASWFPQPTIGQNIELMGEHADYICPMVYPSHYFPQELGFENAAAHPYEIVHESLKHGEEMLEDKRASQRPWLQDFTLLWVPDELIVEYGESEVRAQIEATEDFPPATGWALWNSDNEYTFDAID